MRYSSGTSTRWRFSPASSPSLAQDQNTIAASQPTSSTSSVAGLKMISSTPIAANKSTNASTSSTDPQTVWGGHVRGRLARPDVKWRMLARPRGVAPREVRDRDEPRQPHDRPASRPPGNLEARLDERRCQRRPMSPSPQRAIRSTSDGVKPPNSIGICRVPGRNSRVRTADARLALSHEPERLQVAIQSRPGRASRDRARRSRRGRPLKASPSVSRLLGTPYVSRPADGASLGEASRRQPVR